jgi:hypothetical protein
MLIALTIAKGKENIQNLESKPEKDIVLQFFIATSKVAILQQIYLILAERIAKELANEPIINYD